MIWVPRRRQIPRPLRRSLAIITICTRPLQTFWVWPHLHNRAQQCINGLTTLSQRITTTVEANLHIFLGIFPLNKMFPRPQFPFIIVLLRRHHIPPQYPLKYHLMSSSWREDPLRIVRDTFHLRHFQHRQPRPSTCEHPPIPRSTLMTTGSASKPIRTRRLTLLMLATLSMQPR